MIYWICERYFRPELEEIRSSVEILRAAHFSKSGGTVPEIAVATLITAEDRRFLGHSGFDPIAILRAIFNYLVHRRISGGSTIDQQFVRTLTKHYERTFFRKFREILLAVYLQRLATKKEIAAMYLLIAYFGWQMNGIVQACRRFEISIPTMSVNQAAFVVASLKYPIPKMPTGAFLNRHRHRVEYIVAKMKGGTLK